MDNLTLCCKAVPCTIRQHTCRRSSNAFSFFCCSRFALCSFRRVTYAKRVFTSCTHKHADAGLCQFACALQLARSCSSPRCCRFLATFPSAQAATSTTLAIYQAHVPKQSKHDNHSSPKQEAYQGHLDFSIQILYLSCRGHGFLTTP